MQKILLISLLVNFVCVVYITSRQSRLNSAVQSMMIKNDLIQKLIQSIGQVEKDVTEDYMNAQAHNLCGHFNLQFGNSLDAARQFIRRYEVERKWVLYKAQVETQNQVAEIITGD